MKWVIVQLVESAEIPQLAEGQVGLCCPVADWSRQSGNELLNQIEADAYAIGKQVPQFIFTQQVHAVDAAHSRQRIHEPESACEVVFDGKDPLTFVTRLGVIRVPIQQARCKSHGVDFIPLNRVLPAHGGCLTTPSVQEMSCLFAALSPSYAGGNQLLAITLQEPQLLSDSPSERIVETHGNALRTQEEQQAERVLTATAQDAAPPLPLQTAPAPRRSGLAAELMESVRQKLATADLEHPPAGLSQAKGEGRKAKGEKRISPFALVFRPSDFALRWEGEVGLMLDGVVVRGRSPARQIEECTGRLATPQGFWYISGQGESFRRLVLAALRRLPQPMERLTVRADGARWIRDFYGAELASLAPSELILDWYHLGKRSHEGLSMACAGRQAREELEAKLRPLLWQGEVEAACRLLEGYRSQARNQKKIDDLIE